MKQEFPSFQSLLEHFQEQDSEPSPICHYTLSSSDRRSPSSAYSNESRKWDTFQMELLKKKMPTAATRFDKFYGQSYYCKKTKFPSTSAAKVSAPRPSRPAHQFSPLQKSAFQYFDKLNSGLRNDFTSTELIKCFRQLALRHHPDVGGETSAFRELLKAYQILKTVKIS